MRDGDAVVGVLSQLDLMAFVASHSHLIALQAAQAGDVAELAAGGAADRRPDPRAARDGVRVEVIAGLVGELNRQVFVRLWDLLAPEPLRANSCLIVMGSEGRGEQIVKTDQDNALILRDGFAFEGLEAVTGGLHRGADRVRLPALPGGIMLSRPLWRQPLAGFRDTLRHWIHGADPEGPMNLAIFLDAARGGRRRGAARAGARPRRPPARRSDAFYARFAARGRAVRRDGGWWSRLPGLRGRARRRST